MRQALQQKHFMESLKHRVGVWATTRLEVESWARTSVSPSVDEAALQGEEQETQNDHYAPRS